MANQLIWHGHANYEIITPDTNILIDPWFEGNPSARIKYTDVAKCGLVLLTHDHADHLGQAVEICQNTGAHLGAIVEVAARCAAMGIDQSQIINGIGFNIGGTIKHKDIEVIMTQAVHSSDKGSCVGYIIVLGNGYTIYHAGDTGIFSTMEIWGELYDIDLAILPIGGVFTMDPTQAALACKLLKCKKVTPMHWGSFPVLEQNTEGFKKQLEVYSPETQLMIMNPEDKVEL